MLNQTETIQELLTHLSRGVNFYMLKGNWLDEFYRCDNFTRQKMIDDAPNGEALNNDRGALAFVAAMVHRLANKYGLRVPTWVYKQRYFLNWRGEVYYGKNTGWKARLWSKCAAPVEFKCRNVFISEKTLSRA